MAKRKYTTLAKSKAKKAKHNNNGVSVSAIIAEQMAILNTPIYTKTETITISVPFKGEIEETRIGIYTNPNCRDGLLGYLPAGTGQTEIEYQAIQWMKEDAFIKATAPKSNMSNAINIIQSAIQ